MIEPTVGRVVLYRPAPNEGLAATEGDALAALVTRVHSPVRVNLTVFDADGAPHARQGVYLLQPGNEQHAEGAPYCEWMTYQVGQAAATTALEQRIETLETAAVDGSARIAALEGTAKAQDVAAQSNASHA